MTDSPEIDVWEPWPGESAKAYQAFCAYRDLPTKARSVRAAYEQETGKKIPSGRWTQWSTKFRWVERSRAWDAEADGRKRNEALEARNLSVQRDLAVASFIRAKAFA